MGYLALLLSFVASVLEFIRSLVIFFYTDMMLLLAAVILIMICCCLGDGGDFGGDFGGGGGDFGGGGSGGAVPFRPPAKLKVCLRPSTNSGRSDSRG